jgi:hypothetical protein
MIDKIISGVSDALYKAFGNTYKIYKNQVEQGLKEPCFSIVLLEPEHEAGLGRRYERTTPLCIHYFPKAYGNITELTGVIEKLFDALEYITVFGTEDKLRGMDMHSKTVDGVLSFFVTYKHAGYKETEDIPYMEVLSQSQNAKR